MPSALGSYSRWASGGLSTLPLKANPSSPLGAPRPLKLRPAVLGWMAAGLVQTAVQPGSCGQDDGSPPQVWQVSTLQVALQPSSASVLPSSQASSGPTRPLPHTANRRPRTPVAIGPSIQLLP